MDKDDWHQEAMLVFVELLQDNRNLIDDENCFFRFYKTRFVNYIIDVLRKQESSKRKINKICYDN
jgi:competence protein ComX